MTQWTDTHDKWRNQYEAWHSTPKSHVAEDELEDFRTRYAFFMQLLPEILDGLAGEAEERGIDSTPIINLRGSFSVVWRKTKEFERQMDTVWAIAQRIKLKPVEIEPSELGVSLSDVGLAMGNCDEELRDFVRRFSKSKKITAEKLGKCPIDGRATLHRLFEIVENLHEFSPLSEAEKRRITKQLQQVQRAPQKTE